jgi:hypothetical protein
VWCVVEAIKKKKSTFDNLLGKVEKSGVGWVWFWGNGWS